MATLSTAEKKFIVSLKKARKQKQQSRQKKQQEPQQKQQTSDIISKPKVSVNNNKTPPPSDTAVPEPQWHEGKVSNQPGRWGKEIKERFPDRTIGCVMVAASMFLMFWYI